MKQSSVSISARSGLARGRHEGGAGALAEPGIATTSIAIDGRRSKKIVHMTSAHGAFDVRIFSRECCSLAEAGYDVTLVAPHECDEVRDGVKIHAVKPSTGGRLGRFVLTAMRVFKAAWALKADLYHFHDPDLIPAGALLRLTGAKVIYDVHEDVPRQISEKAWIAKWLRPALARTIEAIEWVCARWVYSGIVTVVPAIADRFPEHKTVLARNYPIAGPGDNQHLVTAYSERDNECLYMGGISRVRGTVEIVQAMKHVETHGATLAIAGMVYHKSVLAEISELPGWNKVAFHGWQNQDEIRQLLGRARMGLLTEHPTPNHQVALPVKMFEYMRAAIPVVVSNIPMWQDVIQKHDCGLVVDPFDAEAIAVAIDWIFANPEEAGAMGQRGRQAILEFYNWNAEERRLIGFYDQLLA